jgi:hypothetical protein
MSNEALFQEQPIRVERPASFYELLCAPDGRFLGIDDAGTLQLFDYVDDKSVWQSDTETATYRHPVTDVVIDAEEHAGGLHLGLQGAAIDEQGNAGENPATFTTQRGPADLPSHYLAHFRENGWVCLPCILDDEIVDGLQQVSSSGAYEDQPHDPMQAPICGNSAVAKATVEPISAWLMRQYMQTDFIKLGHAPSLAVLPPDDGKRDVLAWHADFPYLWGITPQVAGGRIPVHDSGAFCMAIQRNICITDFTKESGATCFKLGSHAKCSPPPEEWGTGAQYSQRGYREQHGLPYTGPEAEVLEAPAGSMVIYDARTWHRTGVNRTEHKRGAMLQAVVPMYIMPFMDTSKPYKAFVNSPIYDELTPREKQEIETLMVHKIVGPMGQFAIGVDRELTEMTSHN